MWYRTSVHTFWFGVHDTHIYDLSANNDDRIQIHISGNCAEMVQKLYEVRARTPNAEHERKFKIRPKPMRNDSLIQRKTTHRYRWPT
jgi:hypothetical protein